MAIHYDEMHNMDTAATRVVVRDDASSKGPFSAKISCGVTGALLGSVERCETVADAIEAGKRLARSKAY